jgi:hypothetical protein
MLNLYNTLKRARSIHVAMATINRPTKLQCTKEAAVEEPAPASTASPSRDTIATKYVKPLDRIAVAERTPTSPKAPARRQKSSQSSPRKDALKPGNPACELYFLIRRSCTGENAAIFDDVETLRKLCTCQWFAERGYQIDTKSIPSRYQVAITRFPRPSWGSVGGILEATKVELGGDLRQTATGTTNRMRCEDVVLIVWCYFASVLFRKREMLNKGPES